MMRPHTDAKTHHPHMAAICCAMGEAASICCLVLFVCVQISPLPACIPIRNTRASFMIRPNPLYSTCISEVEYNGTYSYVGFLKHLDVATSSVR